MGGFNVSVTQETYTPAVPFETPIQGFGESRRIRIVAVPTGRHFEVNLKTPGDIAVHFNPRFDEQSVVRNSFLGGYWGQEERHASFFPYEHGQPFTLELISAPGEIIMNHNGQFLTSFSHRIDPNAITHLNINGDLNIHSVHIGQ